LLGTVAVELQEVVGTAEPGLSVSVTADFLDARPVLGEPRGVESRAFGGLDDRSDNTFGLDSGIPIGFPAEVSRVDVDQKVSFAHDSSDCLRLRDLVSRPVRMEGTMDRLGRGDQSRSYSVLQAMTFGAQGAPGNSGKGEAVAGTVTYLVHRWRGRRNPSTVSSREHIATGGEDAIAHASGRLLARMID
jgi:hypothetical protein